MEPILQKQPYRRTFAVFKRFDELFFFLALAVVLNSFWHSSGVGLVTDYVMILLTIVSVPRLDRTPKLTVLSFLSLGVILYALFFEKMRPATELVSANLGLVTLFILIPLLGLPIHYGGYIEPLKQIFQRHLFQNWKVFSVSSLFSYLLSPVMNVGAISLTANMIPKDRRDFSISQALLRGFGLTIPWSPFFASVIFVLSLLSVNWLSIAPFTFSYTTLMVLMGIVFNRLATNRVQKPNKRSASAGNSNDPPIQWNKVVELAVIMFLMTGSIFLVHGQFELTMTMSVSVVALVFPVLWSIYLKKTGQFLKMGRHYVQETLSKVKNEVMVFFSVSLFGYTFLDTGLGSLLSTFFSETTNNNTYGLILIISLTQIMLTVLGIHPMVVAIVFAGSLVEDTVLHQITISFMILSTWGIALVLSPFAAATLVTSRIFNQSSFFIGFRLNWLFIVFAYLVMVIFAITIEFFVSV